MGQKATNLKVIQGEEISFTIALKNQDGDPVDLTGASLKVQLPKSDDTTVARRTATLSFTDSSVSVSEDSISLSDHGLVDNDVVQLTSSGTLPAGLALATDYYVKVVDKDAVKLSLSLNGEAVNITAAASGGTHAVSALGLAVSGDPLLGKMSVTLSEAATEALKVGELQTIEVEKITSGVKRIIQLKKALTVLPQAY
jgi:hypothetical protein